MSENNWQTIYPPFDSHVVAKTLHSNTHTHGATGRESSSIKQQLTLPVQVTLRIIEGKRRRGKIERGFRSQRLVVLFRTTHADARSDARFFLVTKFLLFLSFSFRSSLPFISSLLPLFAPQRVVCCLWKFLLKRLTNLSGLDRCVLHMGWCMWSLAGRRKKNCCCSLCCCSLIAYPH